MKPVLRLAAAALVAALVCGVIPLGQAAAQMAKLQGTYLLDDPAALPKIKKAVDKVADQMGFFAASIARDRLMEANKPAQKLVITVSGNEVTTQFDNDQAIRTTADGSTVDWTRDNGEKVRVTTTWQGHDIDARRLEQGRDTHQQLQPRCHRQCPHPGRGDHQRAPAAAADLSADLSAQRLGGAGKA